MSRIRSLIEEFATKLEAEFKSELRDALDGVGLGLGPTSRQRSASRTTSNGHRAKGVKRDAASLKSLADRFIGYVTKNPGLRIEQINKELGTTTKDLQLPIRKLIADGELKTKGQKRSTTYVVGKSSSKARPTKKRLKK